MNNKIIYVALIALSTTAFAITAEEKAAQEKENMKMLAQMGLPLPGSGIKIVPRVMLGLTPEEITQGEKELAEFQQNGYVNKYINRPRELLSITDSSVAKEIQTLGHHAKDTYTGFSKTVDHLKLAFEFPTLSKNKTLKTSSSDIHVLAAVPQGGFHEEKGGWSGAAEYFTYKDIGTCSYAIMNVKAANTAAELAQEDVSYTINHKATLLLPVEGSDSSGYLYALKWYDEHNFHEIECANMKYSAETNQALIDLAKRIDKF